MRLLIAGKRAVAAVLLLCALMAVCTVAAAGEEGPDVADVAARVEEQIASLGGKVADMSDAELRSLIDSVTERMNVTLTDGNADRLVSALRRAAEGAENISEHTEDASRLVQKLRTVWNAIAEFFQSVGRVLVSVWMRFYGFLESL
ncbi:MAG: hypothetical protein ACOYIG_12755 [Acetivibrionales bacterium]|jgi:uncharacterized protein YpuA (DUF1002 family)